MTPYSLNLEYLFYQLYLFIQSDPQLQLPLEEFHTWWNVFTTFSTLLSLLFLTGIIYSHIRIKQVKKEFHEKMDALAPHHAERSPRWIRILEAVSSSNPNDWRQAVIDADVMLDEVLNEQGYSGAGVGEKLKSVARGDFKSLNEAWEAHKVRNEVAHAGSDYILTQREARRAIDNFEKVLIEFGKI